MPPGSEAPSAPEGQATSGRDARKERMRLRASTLRALVSAGVCNQQSAGQLSRELLDAAIAARQQGCSSVPELQAALALEEPPSSARAWLSARGCAEHRLNAFAQMLQRLEALDAPRPIVSFLDVHLETLVVVLLGQFKQEAEMRAWHVLFFVQLSKLCRTTRALVLPWLGEREDFLLRLAKEYFVGLQPGVPSRCRCFWTFV